MNRSRCAAAAGFGVACALVASAQAAATTLQLAPARHVLNAPHARDGVSVSQLQLAGAIAALLAVAGLVIALRRGRLQRHHGGAVAASLVVAAVLVLTLVPAYQARSAAVRLTATERGFFVAINQARADHGLAPLTSQARLVRAARSHSDDMVEHDYFAHGVFWKRLEQFGVKSGRMGENLGWISSDDDRVDTLVQDWLNSPEHRANMLSGTYNQIGVAIETGTFEGHPSALVVTTDFLGPA